MGIRDRVFRQWRPTASAGLRRGCPGCSMASHADAACEPRLDGGLEIPLSWDLAGLSSAAGTDCVDGETAICSALLSFVPAGTFSAGCLRPRPDSPLGPDSACVLGISRTISSWDRPRLPERYRHRARRLA